MNLLSNYFVYSVYVCILSSIKVRRGDSFWNLKEVGFLLLIALVSFVRTNENCFPLLVLFCCQFHFSSETSL